MTDQELKTTLIAAREEILSLRRANEVLQAKVDTMELFACVLRTSPVLPRQGFAEDVVWKLNGLIDD